MSGPVLITAPYFLPVVDRYRPFFAEHDLEPRPVDVLQALGEDELVPLVGDVVALLCGDDQITAKVMDAAPGLRVIAKWGTGIDSIDQQAAAARGIPVCRTPGAFNDPVADQALAFMLAFARRLPWQDREIKEGRWTKLPGFALGEATIGIVGCGNIGRAVARRCAAFGARLVGYDPAPEAVPLAESEGIEMTDLPDLLARADVVTLTAAIVDDSGVHLIGAPELAAMRRTAILVNVARGRLVDEQALAGALAAGTIAGAGLDVFAAEPLPADSPLRGMDNVLLSPHNSNSSPTAWERVHESTLAQLVDALA